MDWLFGVCIIIDGDYLELPLKGRQGKTSASPLQKTGKQQKERAGAKAQELLHRNTEDSLSKRKEIFDKTKVEEKQELIHMMNIVGNQLIHEAAGYYGWKEGSTEKLLLHEMRGAE